MNVRVELEPIDECRTNYYALCVTYTKPDGGWIEIEQELDPIEMGLGHISKPSIIKQEFDDMVKAVIKQLELHQ